MTERFWRLTVPDYDSDYHGLYINGILAHPSGLPGIRCDFCGETWSGSRILPYPCPQELRQKLDSPWPISEIDHKKLRNVVINALKRDGWDIKDLWPGDVFQPGYLDVPSLPSADFLWSSPGSVVVSESVKEALLTSNVKGVVFCPIIPRKIVKRSPKRPPPMPKSGEPEDLLEEIHNLVSPDHVPTYYEMVVVSESGYPPGGEPIHVCTECGRGKIDNRTRRLEMHLTMWKGDDIFFLATTLWIIITDRVKQLLDKFDTRNVRFELL